MDEHAKELECNLKSSITVLKDWAAEKNADMIPEVLTLQSILYRVEEVSTLLDEMESRRENEYVQIMSKKWRG